jgi:CheY-like chemotaxis protein
MSRTRIIVIEDNTSDIFLLRRALTAKLGEGFDLEIAPDGEQALHMIQTRAGSGKAQPCVILLDLHLPKHDGLEILHALRQSAILGDVRVVVTTNSASPSEERALKSMGADYRSKPRTLGEFDELAAYLVALCKGERIAA